ncbi:DNA-formamidopyrimidine glycosylase [Salsuginibacillus kocurii]|uniref:DNA-formamidopyrimidine glycosylase n=1 Tax=Salsuginibacillus kocurii TaxID=427078 RepID=UPI000362E471|nr:DNA-formamidopyrimidine glycosylase [Salsuginibacillus kocurii]
MPELPEVETVRRTLGELIKGKTIDTMSITWAKIIKEPDDVEAFISLLAGQTIQEVKRRGKFLLIECDEVTLVSHLRMEGKYKMKEGEPDKHTHVRFHFTDGTELWYRDVRKFGTMHVFPKGAEFSQEPLKKLGVEPLSLDFTPSYLPAACEKTSRNIKTVLLDQSIIAGLGNIYVDEALFRSGILPERQAAYLQEEEWQRLHAEIKATLEEAVEAGGTSVRSYLNGNGEMGYFQQQLFVYGRAGEPCQRCSGPIEKTVVAGRGTHFCPVCQP